MSEYPRKLAVRYKNTVRTYTDPSFDSRTIICQVMDDEGNIIDENIMPKIKTWDMLSAIEAWYMRKRNDHQNEMGDIVNSDDLERMIEDEVPSSDEEFATVINAIASEVSDFVSIMEKYLDGEGSLRSPELNEARYQMRVAAEHLLCAAHRVYDLIEFEDEPEEL